MAVLHIETPGFLSTVQDLGRYGHVHLGISASGAADALALRLGNLLLSNEPGAAAIEMTLSGATVVFGAQARVAVAGADFGAQLCSKPVAPWTAFDVRAGDRLQFGSTRAGARCYLCVHGGLRVAAVFGSASTHLVSGLGGLRGRALAAGDTLEFAPTSGPGSVRRAGLDPRWIEHLYAKQPLRITPGPQVDCFTDAGLTALVKSEYRVLESSNRMGIRLAGPPIARARAAELLTEGVSLGAIQVPADGQPIILFVEHQTTGGYPKIANTCSADLHVLGQLRPRDVVRFQFVTLDEAHKLYVEREMAMRRLELRPGTGRG